MNQSINRPNRQNSVRSWASRSWRGLKGFMQRPERPVGVDSFLVLLTDRWDRRHFFRLVLISLLSLSIKSKQTRVNDGYTFGWCKWLQQNRKPLSVHSVVNSGTAGCHALVNHTGARMISDIEFTNLGDTPSLRFFFLSLRCFLII